MSTFLDVHSSVTMKEEEKNFEDISSPFESVRKHIRKLAPLTCEWRGESPMKNNP